MSQVVIDNKTNYLNIKKEINKFQSRFVKVGILSDRYVNKNGENVLQYAIANEFGTEKIPERSFIRSTADNQKNKWIDAVDEDLGLIYENKLTANQALARLGTIGQKDIKETINNNVPPPNAESTIRKKGSSKTLIDTGAMLESIEYAVVQK